MVEGEGERASGTGAGGEHGRRPQPRGDDGDTVKARREAPRAVSERNGKAASATKGATAQAGPSIRVCSISAISSVRTINWRTAPAQTRPWPNAGERRPRTIPARASVGPIRKKMMAPGSATLAKAPNRTTTVQAARRMSVRSWRAAMRVTSQPSTRAPWRRPPKWSDRPGPPVIAGADDACEQRDQMRHASASEDRDRQGQDGTPGAAPDRQCSGDDRDKPEEQGASEQRHGDQQAAADVGEQGAADGGLLVRAGKLPAGGEDFAAYVVEAAAIECFDAVAGAVVAGLIAGDGEAQGFPMLSA